MGHRTDMGQDLSERLAQTLNVLIDFRAERVGHATFGLKRLD